MACATESSCLEGGGTPGDDGEVLLVDGVVEVGSVCGHAFGEVQIPGGSQRFLVMSERGLYKSST
jgi:hypothetical protein